MMDMDMAMTIFTTIDKSVAFKAFILELMSF